MEKNFLTLLDKHKSLGAQQQLFAKTYTDSDIPFCVLDQELDTVWYNRAMERVCPGILTPGYLQTQLSVTPEQVAESINFLGCYSSAFQEDSIFTTNGFVIGRMQNKRPIYYYCQARMPLDRGTARNPKGLERALEAFEYTMRTNLYFLQSALGEEPVNQQQIQNSANLLLRSVVLISDYSRLSNGFYFSRHIPTELFSLLKELLCGAQEIIEKTAIDFFYENPPALCYSSLDTVLLTTIICHLLSNAVRFCGGEKKIYFKNYIENQKLFLTISNTGDSLTPEQMSLIYDPYRCFPPPGDGPFQGCGLGLTIARAGAVFMGGSLTSLSRNEGVSFRLTIPIPEVYIDENQTISINTLPGYPDVQALVKIIMADCFEPIEL